MARLPFWGSVKQDLPRQLAACCRSGAGAALTRRQLMRTLLLSPPGASLLPACRDRGKSSAAVVPLTPSWSPRYFTQQRALTLDAAVDAIIPGGDPPGAKAAGVARFVEDIVADVQQAPEQQRFNAGLDALERSSQQAFQRVFARCSPTQRIRLLAAWLPPNKAEPSSELTDFAKELRWLTIEGYCRSELGATRLLQYEPIPGRLRACIPLREVGRPWATH
jgi:gluconate 2-dehydrogenase gamma chain